jgi:hypothetical protein
MPFNRARIALGAFIGTSRRVHLAVDTYHFFCYVFGMARPLKNPRLRMDIDLRIPVTADQKRRIMDAVADEPGGFAAWAREVLLRAAQAKTRVAGVKRATE